MKLQTLRRQVTVTLFLFTALAAQGEIKVEVGKVYDQRATQKMMSNLTIDLLLSGKELLQFKGYKIAVDKAVDDTGRNLIMNDRSGSNDGSFSELRKPLGSYVATEDERGVDLRLQNPAREAKTVSLSGTLFFHSPTADPASLITVKPRDLLNQAVDHPALKEAKIKIVFQKIEDDSVKYSMSDPSKKVASIQLYDGDGKRIHPNSWSKFGSEESQTCTINVKKLPQVFEARFHLVTEKSVIKLPWKLDQVALP